MNLVATGPSRRTRSAYNVWIKRLNRLLGGLSPEKRKQIKLPLPPPPEQVYMLENYRPAWADAPASPADGHFPEFPDESIQDWHEKRGLLTED